MAIEHAVMSVLDRHILKSNLSKSLLWDCIYWEAKVGTDTFFYPIGSFILNIRLLTYLIIIFEYFGRALPNQYHGLDQDKVKNRREKYYQFLYQKNS